MDGARVLIRHDRMKLGIGLSLYGGLAWGRIEGRIGGGGKARMVVSEEIGSGMYRMGPD